MLVALLMIAVGCPHAKGRGIAWGLGVCVCVHVTTERNAVLQYEGQGSPATSCLSIACVCARRGCRRTVGAVDASHLFAVLFATVKGAHDMSLQISYFFAFVV